MVSGIKYDTKIFMTKKKGRVRKEFRTKDFVGGVILPKQKRRK